MTASPRVFNVVEGSINITEIWHQILIKASQAFLKVVNLLLIRNNRSEFYGLTGRTKPAICTVWLKQLKDSW